VGDVHLCVAFPFAPGLGGTAITPSILKDRGVFAPEPCADTGGGGDGKDGI